MRWLANVLLVGVVACQVVGGIDERGTAVLPTEPPGADTDGGLAASCSVSDQPTCEGNAPKSCVDGQWVVEKACAGAKPVCLRGACASNRSCASVKPGAGPSCGGASGTSDCCESPVVAGGTFYRNYDGNGSQVPGADGLLQTRIVTFDDPSYPATVSDFRLDAFEVTVGRFRAFVADNGGTQVHAPAKGAGAHPKAPKSGWDPEWNSRLLHDRRELEAALSCGKQVDDPTTWTDQPGPYESHPMLCVDWYEAFAFCAWDGGRLPSDAELNFAASGGSEQRLYPWKGDRIGKEYAVYGCYDMTCLAPVGSRPKGRGRWGQFDLLGSAGEWTLDTYDIPHVPCDDCVATQDWVSRQMRGASYAGHELIDVYSAYSNGKKADARLGMGFRCARDQ